MSQRILEICCESVPSALRAAAGGADRIELCSNLAQGGTTPSGASILAVKRLLPIPVFVLIRPRKADFLYSNIEFDIMLEDIAFAKSSGADGIVSGVLKSDGTVDYQRVSQLVTAANPLPFTFHRAFDMCKNPLKAIGELREIGVKRILTSGQSKTAVEGIANLQRFVEKAAANISIMACGNLLPQNIDRITQIDGLTEFHSAARTMVQSEMTYFGATNMGDEGVEAEFCWSEVDENMVRKMREILDGGELLV